jgi:hypothetical protein
MTKVLSFRDLDAWNAAMDLVIATYHLCRVFPGEEKYGLARQMQRAATSVPSNVAEGHAHGLGLRYRNMCVSRLDPWQNSQLSWRLQFG